MNKYKEITKIFEIVQKTLNQFFTILSYNFVYIKRVLLESMPPTNPHQRLCHWGSTPSIFAHRGVLLTLITSLALGALVFVLGSLLLAQSQGAIDLKIFSNINEMNSLSIMGAGVMGACMLTSIIACSRRRALPGKIPSVEAHAPQNTSLMENYFDCAQRLDSQTAECQNARLQATNGVPEVQQSPTVLDNQRKKLRSELGICALELHNIFISSGLIERETPITLAELASGMKVKENQLTQLFDQRDFPSCSRSDVGCLNAFFVLLVASETVDLSVALALNLLVSLSHPLWPEDKMPSKNALTCSEFACFLGMPSKECHSLLVEAGIEIAESRMLTPDQMKTFADWATKGANALTLPQSKIKLIKFCNSWKEPWTRDRQKRMRPNQTQGLIASNVI